MIARNRVRLEVETPTAGLPNLLRNPSGDAEGGRAEYGVAYWSEPLAQLETNPGNNNRLTSPGRPGDLPGMPYLRLYQQSTTSDTQTAHAPVPVVAGRFVAARVNYQKSDGIFTGSTRVAPPVRIGIRFLNAAGNQVSLTWGASSSAPSPTTVLRVNSTTVPSGAVAAQLVVQVVRSDESGGTFFNQAMLTTSTSAIPSTFDYADPRAWTDILGKAGDITVNRLPMDVGLLTAQLRGAALDPARVDTIRPGKAVRLRVQVAGVWETVFTGQTRDGTTAYVDRSRKTRPVVAITLVATDRGAELANVSEPRVVVQTDFASAEDLMQQLIADANLPYERGAGQDFAETGHLPAAVAKYPINQGASLLDQIVLYRDSNSFLTYFTRRGAFHDGLSSSATEPQTTRHQQRFTLSDQPGTQLGYVEIDRGWSTEDCINDVTVNFVRLLSSGQTQENAYGPYRNQASVDAWGARSATYNITGPVESRSAINTFAQRILTANANPVVRCKSLKLRAETEAEIAAVATIDHYDVLDVTHQGVTTTGLVDGITHELRVSGKTGRVKWHTAYTFLTRGATAPPSATPPPPPSVGGGYDDWTELPIASGVTSDAVRVVQFKLAGGILHMRGVIRRSSNFSTTADTLIGRLPNDLALSAFGADRRPTTIAGGAFGSVLVNADTREVFVNVTGATQFVNVTVSIPQ